MARVPPVVPRPRAIQGLRAGHALRPQARPHGNRRLSPAELGRLVSATAAAAPDWLEIVQFTPESRWFHRLRLVAEYEIWLLSWLPGQHTGFHDHGTACGAFTVARGELLETRGTPGSCRLRRRTAEQGSVTMFGGHHLHDVRSNSAGPAISVHAYSPPLSAMQRYEMTQTGLALIGTQRAEQDW